MYISSPSSRDARRNAAVISACAVVNPIISNIIIIKCIVYHWPKGDKFSKKSAPSICWSPLTQNIALNFQILPPGKPLQWNTRWIREHSCTNGGQKYPITFYFSLMYPVLILPPPNNNNSMAHALPHVIKGFIHHWRARISLSVKYNPFLLFGGLISP